MDQVRKWATEPARTRGDLAESGIEPVVVRYTFQLGERWERATFPADQMASLLRELDELGALPDADAAREAAVWVSHPDVQKALGFATEVDRKGP
jgi:hypothetical protein